MTQEFIETINWEELFNHCKIEHPAHNAEFKINISGMRWTNLAAYLKFLSELIMHVHDKETTEEYPGTRAVIVQGSRVPFANTSITYSSLWPWEEGFEENYESGSLIHGIELITSEEVATSRILLSDETVNDIKENKNIVDALIKKLGYMEEQVKE